MSERRDVPNRFDEASRAAIYSVIELRRDIRSFGPGRVEADVLDRVLRAALLAPSVGFSQPAAFVVVRNHETRARIRANFLKCREAEAARFPPERREQYLAYKLEGITDAALNLCVVADLRPRENVILGTTVQPESVRASVSCAVQNLWLAARAEGLGVGWVSIIELAVLREELGLPPGVEPVAYLCVGEADEFRARPLLEETGWGRRVALDRVLHEERWPASEYPKQERALPEAVRGSIPVFDEASRRASLDHQKQLTKPLGSLGRLEEVAGWYAGAHGRFPPPRPDRALVAVFAADHGVVVEGVSAYPSSVTAAMVATVMAGGAAINSIAGRLGVEIALVDVGVAGDLSGLPTAPRVPLVSARVRAGTGNIRREQAMTRDDAAAAMRVGEATAARAVADGHELLAVGEIGIGNTTAAAAMVCLFAAAAPDDVVGRGTGIDEATRLHKVRVVEDALRRHDFMTPGAEDQLGILASLGGLELAAIAGFLLEAARLRKPVVLDGFLATAAALAAKAFHPGVVDFVLLSHASAERGAAVASAALGQTPLFDLGMRLGEGTGAVLGLDLVRTAIEVQMSTATFATAGIVRTNPRSP